MDAKAGTTLKARRRLDCWWMMQHWFADNVGVCDMTEHLLFLVVLGALQ